jgi:hypothetical protein
MGRGKRDRENEKDSKKRAKQTASQTPTKDESDGEMNSEEEMEDPLEDEFEEEIVVNADDADGDEDAEETNDNGDLRKRGNSKETIKKRYVLTCIVWSKCFCDHLLIADHLRPFD